MIAIRVVIIICAVIAIEASAWAAPVLRPIDGPTLRFRAPRVMAIGDSLTVGWTPADPLVAQGGYRSHLHALMNGRVEWVGRQIHGPQQARLHEGYGGFHIRRHHHQKLFGAMQQPADIVLLMIGTNDAWHPGQYDSLSTRENMISNLTAFMQSLWNYQPNVRVILSTLPYIHDEPSQQAVAAFNAGLPDLVGDFQSMGRPVRLVDSYARMTPGMTLTDSDGVHPNAIGYQRIAEAFFSDPWLSSFGPLPPVSVQTPEPSSRALAALVVFPLCLAGRRAYHRK
jgi:lysophospholipase L1-like esterase